MTALALAVDGADTLTNTVEDAADELGDLTAENRAAARLVLAAVKPPVVTGRLRDSIAVTTDGRALGFTITAGSNTAPYARYVHAANPFLTRALDKRLDDVAHTYTQAVHHAVDQIKGS